MTKTIGILAMQGAFSEHAAMLEQLGTHSRLIRRRTDFSPDLDGLILPGGESTVMGKLLHELELFEPLQQAIANGLPTFGTCAGMILLAASLSQDSDCHLGLLNARVRRNAYGRQLGSFDTCADMHELGRIPMRFIRAPFIEQLNISAALPAAHALATVNGHLVAARQNNLLVTSFHPELTTDLQVHRYFLEKIAG